MKTRPITLLLTTLADETDDLAALAVKLDAVIPQLVANITDKTTINFQGLQSVDTVAQRLSDTSQVLRQLADLLDPSLEISISKLVDAVQLDDFKMLLNGRFESQSVRDHRGSTQLF